MESSIISLTAYLIKYLIYVSLGCLNIFLVASDSKWLKAQKGPCTGLAGFFYIFYHKKAWNLFWKYSNFQPISSLLKLLSKALRHNIFNKLHLPSRIFPSFWFSIQIISEFFCGSTTSNQFLGKKTSKAYKFFIIPSSIENPFLCYLIFSLHLVLACNVS